MPDAISFFYLLYMSLDANTYATNLPYPYDWHIPYWCTFHPRARNIDKSADLQLCPMAIVYSSLAIHMDKSSPSCIVVELAMFNKVIFSSLCTQLLLD